MDALKQILQQILHQNARFTEKKEEFKIYEMWPKVVGERIAKHVWPVKLLPEGLLLVASQSSTWLHQLRYLESQIVEKFRRELKSDKIKGLRFKIGAYEEPTRPLVKR